MQSISSSTNNIINKIKKDNKTILITGASKGLGLELVHQFSKDEWDVMACVRDPSKIDKEFFPKNVSLAKLDVNNMSEIKRLVSRLKNHPVDVIINNAGVYYERDFGQTLKKEFSEMYFTHVLAPLMITEKLFNNIKRSREKLIILISGRMGSFGNNTGGGNYGYRASKAAENMIAKTLATDLKTYGIKVLALHPGWIKTRMGGADAKIDITQSASGIKNIVLNQSKYSTGNFYTFDGNLLEW